MQVLGAFGEEGGSFHSGPLSRGAEMRRRGGVRTGGRGRLRVGGESSAEAVGSGEWLG